MALIKYIKQPLAATLAQYTDAELRKIEQSIFGIVQSVEELQDIAGEEGAFVASGTGFTTVPTVNVTYKRMGQIVSLFIPTIAATSNATTFTLTGMPVSIIPQIQQGHDMALIINNGAAASVGGISVLATGVITVYATASNLSAAGWTAANNKSLIRKNLVYHL